MNRVVLRNARLVTMDPQRRVLDDHVLVIQEGRISAITPAAAAPPDPAAEELDLRGRIVIPGLINTHVHTVQQLGRGLADDVDLLTWLRKRTWPYESNMTDDDSYVSTLLCGMEQIMNGVTTVADAGVQHADGTVRALTQIGLRAALCRSIMDSGEGLPPGWVRDTADRLAVQEDEIRRHHGAADGRLRYWLGLRTIFNTSDALITGAMELAEKYGVGVHMHVAEIPEEIAFARATRGDSTVRHLARLGALRPNLLAVHCVWMEEDEIDLFARFNVKVSHNPAAAMKVLGFARIPEMIARGITVGIGTDGAPANNRMSLVDEIWLTSLIHKGRLLDPTVLPAEKLLEMATIDGARCLLWDREIGSLEVGKQADLAVVNPQSPNMLPLHDPVGSLVYAMKTENIESTMVAGRWLMRDRQFLTVDAQAVYREAQARADAVRRRAGIDLPPRFART